jgi:hypothetical protein
VEEEDAECVGERVPACEVGRGLAVTERVASRVLEGEMVRPRLPLREAVPQREGEAVVESVGEAEGLALGVESRQATALGM